jgi:hypothetical protein
MYIPSCPLSEANAEYLVRQREAFLAGTPGPDFPGGTGEADHIGRPSKDGVMCNTSIEAQRAMGLVKWDAEETNLSNADILTLRRANTILGF